MVKVSLRKVKYNCNGFIYFKDKGETMIKVAIIGTGGISPAHIKANLAFPARSRIVALCDIYPEKTKPKAKE